MALEVGEIIERRVHGEVLHDGEVAPARFARGLLHEQIDPGDGVGEGGDVIIHRASDDILLRADQPDVGDRHGLPLVKQTADLPHVVHLTSGSVEPMHLRAGMRGAVQ